MYEWRSALFSLWIGICFCEGREERKWVYFIHNNSYHFLTIMERLVGLGRHEKEEVGRNKKETKRWSACIAHSCLTKYCAQFIEEIVIYVEALVHSLISCLVDMMGCFVLLARIKNPFGTDAFLEVVGSGKQQTFQREENETALGMQYNVVMCAVAPCIIEIYKAKFTKCFLCREEKKKWKVIQLFVASK